MLIYSLHIDQINVLVRVCACVRVYVHVCVCECMFCVNVCTVNMCMRIIKYHTIMLRL